MTTPRHRATPWPVVRRQELRRYRLRPSRPYKERESHAEWKTFPPAGLRAVHGRPVSGQFDSSAAGSKEAVTMIYTHILNQAGGRGVRSPLDVL